jgi:ribonuclease BN (tRNA processing enzyme)
VRLTTIGTGTAAPHPTRVAAGHLVEAGDVRLLLDCGSGIAHRLASLQVDWRTITHVAITHFHADHMLDLPMLVMGWRWGQLPPRTDPLTLYGPPGTGALVERLAAAVGAWLLAPGFPFTVRELAPDEVVALPGGVRLSSHPVPHTAESVAYSVEHDERRLVYTGDTGYDEALGAWAEGCDLLLAECSLPDAMRIAGHCTPREAGALAARARAARLVLTHFYPPVEAVDIVAEVATHHAGPVVLATDGWSIEF